MNGWSLRKRLMRNRVRSFGGAPRVQLTVRIPTSVMKTQCPEPPKFDLLDRGNGTWYNDEEGEFIIISETDWSHDPRTISHQPWEKPHFVEPDKYGGFISWTGFRGIGDERKVLSEEVIGQYRAFQNWIRDVGQDKECKLLSALNHAGHLGSGCAIFVAAPEFKEIFFRYNVKYRNRAREKLRFCAAIRHAMKIAKKMDVPIRVLR